MTKIIAEIGLNHLGNPKKLFNMITQISKCKVDAVTIQIQADNYYDFSKTFRKKIDFKIYKKISKFLKSKKIKFGLAIVDHKTIGEFSSINVDFWKILSMQFFNHQLINKALKTKKEVFLSTGIVSMKDIKNVAKKFKSINLIHTSFSSKIKDANLLAIERMKKEINNKVSFGLHSVSDDLIISAIALKSDSVFFYVKYNDKNIYPDHEHAVNIDVLRAKVKNWRKMILSLGNGIKKRQSLPKWVFE